MVVFKGHGMLSQYNCNIELKQPENLKKVLNELKMSEEVQEQIIFVKGHIKLEDDSTISNDDQIHMFMVTCGG